MSLGCGWVSIEAVRVASYRRRQVISFAKRARDLCEASQVLAAYPPRALSCVEEVTRLAVWLRRL